jgi:pilus assembly protein CpaF
VISRDIFERTLPEFFAPIRSLLSDPAVTEIMINGPAQVYVERGGRIVPTPARFAGLDALLAALRNAAQFVGKQLDEQHPILEGRLPDGSRLEAVVAPAAPDGPLVCIRRFPEQTRSLAQLVELGALTPDAAAFLQACVAARLNLLIGGGAGSGKTTLLAALASNVPPDERVVTIEECREMRLAAPHVVVLEARGPDAYGRGTVSVRDLFQAALRLRPDRIIIGEIRGPEALDIVQAVTSGHSGCLGTLHAALPCDSLNRLETLCVVGGCGLPLSFLRSQIASGVDVLVQLSRQPGGARSVTHVTEVVGVQADTGGYELRDLFVLRGCSAGHGATPPTQLVPTGFAPACQAKLSAYGQRLPFSMCEAAARACPSRK